MSFSDKSAFRESAITRQDYGFLSLRNRILFNSAENMVVLGGN